MTDPSEALDTTDGAAAAMEYLDSREAATSDPEPEAETPEVVEQVEEESASEEPVVEEPEAEANPEGEPGSEDEPAADSVYKDFPDEIRADLEAAETPEQVAEILRANVLMQADYTRKTQELKRQRERFEAEAAEVRQKAGFWDEFMANPESLRAVSGGDAGSDDDLDPYDALTPKQVDERIEARIRAHNEQAVREDETLRRQSEARQEALGEAAAEYAKIHNLSGEALTEIANRAGEHIEALGLDPTTHITPDNLAGWLDPHREAAKRDAAMAERAAAADKSKLDATRAQRASSPSGNRTPAVVDEQPWIAEGRDATPQELRELTKKQYADAGIDLSKIPD